jgi:hypothetical protein
MAFALSRSIALVKASWEVLKKDREILLFPILSGAALFLIIISFFIPLLVLGLLPQNTEDLSPWWYVAIVVFYLIAYFIMTFFNVGLVTCARIRLEGGDPTLKDGLLNATHHLGAIVAWAIVSATVGLVLQAISSRAGVIGKLVIGLVGAAWSLATYFVIPVLIFEGTDVFGAVRRSLSLLRSTWGEAIIGSGSIGLIAFLLIIPAFIVAFIVLFLNNIILLIATLSLVVLYIAGVTVFFTSLQGIYHTALYLYASTGKVPSAFNQDLIVGAFKPETSGGSGGSI